MPLRVEKIDDIKKKLQDEHNVTLTPQMTNALDVYAEGKTPEFVKFPPDAADAPAAAAAPAPTPASASRAAPATAAAPAPIPASASTAADDAQPPAQPDADKSNKKRKLWEKLAEAKKAKT